MFIEGGKNDYRKYFKSTRNRNLPKNERLFKEPEGFAE